jgi:hypothetical protein
MAAFHRKQKHKSKATLFTPITSASASSFITFFLFPRQKKADTKFMRRFAREAEVLTLHFGRGTLEMLRRQNVSRFDSEMQVLLEQVEVSIGGRAEACKLDIDEQPLTFRSWCLFSHDGNTQDLP